MLLRGIMRLYLKWIVMIVLCIVHVAAHSHDQFFRLFWYPMYHGERLAYCAKDGKKCGEDIAKSYCKDMGYSSLKKQRIEHHVGKTYFWEQGGECVGWRCDGFLWIGCAGKFKSHPLKAYAYRVKVFRYPRFENHRIDWCLNQGKSCGHRAAYSYCRRMGYSKEKQYSQDTQVFATRTLGDRVLCYGKKCRGFDKIECQR